MFELTWPPSWPQTRDCQQGRHDTMNATETPKLGSESRCILIPFQTNQTHTTCIDSNIYPRVVGLLVLKGALIKYFTWDWCWSLKLYFPVRSWGSDYVWQLMTRNCSPGTLTSLRWSDCHTKPAATGVGASTSLTAFSWPVYLIPLNLRCS